MSVCLGPLLPLLSLPFFFLLQRNRRQDNIGRVVPCLRFASVWCQARSEGPASSVQCQSRQVELVSACPIFIIACHVLKKCAIRLTGTTRHMHRGPQMGRITKTASKKQSVRRASEIFPHLQPPLPHLPFALPTVAPPQSAQQREYILKWVCVHASHQIQSIHLFFRLLMSLVPIRILTRKNG